MGWMAQSAGVAILAAWAGVALAQPAPNGAQLYAQRCAACHENPTDRVPPRYLFTVRSTDSVIRAMADGPMKQQAAGLKPEEMAAVASFLTGRPPGDARAEADPATNLCKAAGRASATGAWTSWGGDAFNRRFQTKGAIKKGDIARLQVKWAWAYPGESAYGQPVLAGDRLYLGSATGRIFALDARTGCTQWSFKADNAVKAAISLGAANGKPVAFLGDLSGYAYALDAQTGALLWKIRADEHPATRVTGSPVYHKGRVYIPVASLEEGVGMDANHECCSFRGGVLAVDAATGRTLWRSYTIQEELKVYRTTGQNVKLTGPAGGAVWSAPTIDEKRGLIYVGSGNSYTEAPTAGTNAIIAFDMATGERRWATQVKQADNWLFGCKADASNCPSPMGPDVDFASPPILASLAGGKQLLVAASKEGIAYGFDPDARGKIVWQTDVGKGAGGVMYGSGIDGEKMYVALAVRQDRPTAEPPNVLAALDLATGTVAWTVPAGKPVCAWGPKPCSPAHAAAVTLVPGAVFSGGADGHIRAYAAKDGRLLWDFDTAAQPYKAVNGIPAVGGEIGGGAQIVANGALYLNSGYTQAGRMGNALLMFTVEGK